ncbi:MAG: tetratricopeptide repeat protein [Alphaproteobacteria bacterium]|nr:tetratricopeptide repeat protein [Alphaproteobacteria bacterium]
MSQQQEILQILRRAGEMSDESVSFADTALALAALSSPGIALAPYRRHLDALVRQIKASGPATSLADRLTLLRRVLVVQHKYIGDEDNGDDPQTANLIQVIDKRRGVSIALGIIYMHVAEALGWQMSGLNFPGHFYVRLGALNDGVILDPFRAGQTCCLDDLRAKFLDQAEDEDEDALPNYDTPASKRDVLLRLQHNVKLRQLSQNRLDDAITTLQSMILIAPRRSELWRELGHLQAGRGNLRSAIASLEIVRGFIEDTDSQQQAETILQQLKWQLN